MPTRRSGIFALLTVAIAVPFSVVAKAQDATAPQPSPSTSTSTSPQPSASTTPATAPAGAANRSPDHIPPVEPAPSAAAPTGHFEFGSYGRVVIASDGRGGTGRSANIVAHGDRIDEDSYAELELRREDTWTDRISSKVVTTVALFPPFFHFSGDLSQSIVVRNLYAQANYDNLTLWVGSRMYRGDDIYLLDWWPLDNQNTLGGGAGLSFGDTRIAAHVGMNRLDNPLYYEQVTATAPLGFGSTTATVLDRPRMIETLKATRLFRQPNSKAGFKAVLYGEVHELSAGLYPDTTLDTQKPLPRDSGFMVGGETSPTSPASATHSSSSSRGKRTGSPRTIRSRRR